MIKDPPGNFSRGLTVILLLLGMYWLSVTLMALVDWKAGLALVIYSGVQAACKNIRNQVNRNKQGNINL